LALNSEEEELCKAEQSFSNELLGVILYLNINGMHIDRVKQMIDLKVKYAFEKYESESIREKFLRDERLKREVKE
jgi:hypothetical protein